MNILMISPDSPPKNSPESMQVGRYLKELDKYHDIVLVTTPVEYGWVMTDTSLEEALRRTTFMQVSLPLHRFTARLLALKGFNYLSYPDHLFWIQYRVENILKKLKRSPNIIYSRSVPFSSALMAYKLKQRLQIPWVMHLSDPVYNNPYRTSSSKDEQLKRDEHKCFEFADHITVTTKQVLEFYRAKYPKYVDKLSVMPNVMPHKNLKGDIVDIEKQTDRTIKMVYAGALYGQRNFDIFLEALTQIQKEAPQYLEQLQIEVIGNMTDEIASKIDRKNFKCIRIIGRLSYKETVKKQKSADILISIEPDGDDPLLKTFLPSKILDYLALEKPILALTPEGSETWNICNVHGFGYAVKPDDITSLAQHLLDIIDKKKGSDMLHPDYDVLVQYRVDTNVLRLNTLFEQLKEGAI